MTWPPPDASSFFQSASDTTGENKQSSIEEQIAMTPSWNPSLMSRTDPATTQGYTKKPQEGFPRIHFSHPFFVVMNQEEKQRRGWGNAAGPKLLLHPFHHGGGNEEEGAEVKEVLTTTINYILQRDDCEVRAPKPAEATYIHNAPPHCFLLVGITEDEHERLMSQQLWSFPHITFQVLEFDFTIPYLIHTIKGISARDGSAKQAVLDAFHKPQALRDILRLAANNPAFAGVPQVDILEYILASIKVESVDCKQAGGIRQDVVNILIASPTAIVHEWLGWQGRVRGYEYFAPLDGLAKPAGGWKCNACHGAGHPTGLCPCLQVPGWNGLRPSDPPAPLPASSSSTEHTDTLPLSSIDVNVPTRGRGFRPATRGRPGRAFGRSLNWRT